MDHRNIVDPELLTEITTNEQPPLDWDDFCKGLLYGEFDIKHTGGDVSSTGDTAPKRFERKYVVEEDNAEPQGFELFRTDRVLLHQSTCIIPLSYAKGLMVKKLDSMFKCLAVPISRNGKRRSAGDVACNEDSNNPYAKRRLPFLRQQNREKFASEWEHSKVVKQFDPTAFNSRFRRRIRKAVTEEPKTGDTDRLQIKSEALLPPLATHRTIDSDYASALDSNKAEFRVDQNSVPVTVQNSYFGRRLPEHMSLPGLVDFTFLCSPESQTWMDGEQIELTEKVGPQEKEKRILDHIMDTLMERKNKHVIDVNHTACDTVPEITSSQIQLSNFCRLSGDRSFVLANKELNKNEQGRPLQFEQRKLKTKPPQILNPPQTPDVHATFVNHELFKHYMNLRKDVVEHGVPEQCLPTIPKGAAESKSRAHKIYFTTQRLNELIAHVSSMIPACHECDSTVDVMPKLLQDKPKTTRTSSISTSDESDDEEDEPHEDIFAISKSIDVGLKTTSCCFTTSGNQCDEYISDSNDGDVRTADADLPDKIRKVAKNRSVAEDYFVSNVSIVKPCSSGGRKRETASRSSVPQKKPTLVGVELKKMKIPDQNEENISYSSDGEVSMADSNLSVKIKKMLENRIVRADDLLSNISSSKYSVRGRKRKPASKKLALFSDSDSDDDCHSVASARVRRLLRARIISDSDLISELSTSHGGAKKKRKESFDETQSTVSSRAELETILKDRIVAAIDVLSDIRSNGSLKKKRKRRKKSGTVSEILGDLIDVAVISDLSGDELEDNSTNGFKLDIASGTKSDPADATQPFVEVEPPEIPLVTQDHHEFVALSPAPTGTESVEVVEAERLESWEFPEEVAETVEIWEENQRPDQNESTLSHYDNVGTSIWGPVKEIGEAGRRGTISGFVAKPDAIASGSGVVDKETQEKVQSQIAGALDISLDNCAQLSQEFSAEVGRHSCTLVASQNFHGETSLFSRDPSIEYSSPHISHVLELFAAFGFLHGEGDNYRVQTQVGNAKDRIQTQPKKRLGCRGHQRKLILKVAFYQSNPGEYLEHTGNNYMNFKSRTPLTLEFLESQLVEDLRKCLHCVADCVATTSRSETTGKIRGLEDIAYHTNPQWFMVIDDTIVYDGRHTNSIEAANAFARYTADTLKTNMYFLDASKNHIGDLNVRFGYPYRLFHQDACLHTVVFQGARLTENIEEMKSVFPKYVQQNMIPDLVRCELDGESLAEWVLTGSSRLEDKDYLFLCKKCANEVLDSEEPQTNHTFRGGFRIQFDSTGRGRVMDSESDRGWNHFPYVLPRSEEYEVKTLFGTKDPPRRIYVEIPEKVEPPKLYRFVQPFLLHKAIKQSRPQFAQRIPKNEKPTPKRRPPKKKPKTAEKP